MLVSIDPGLNVIGFSAWTDRGILLIAGLAKNPAARNKALSRPEVWAAGASALARRVGGVASLGSDPGASLAIVIEVPVVRQRGSGKGDPNDLIEVAGVVSACVVTLKLTYGAHVVWAPKPEEWKGQLPKEISAQRVAERLSEEEKSRVEQTNPGLMHNVIDSIHLGIVHFKR